MDVPADDAPTREVAIRALTRFQPSPAHMRPRRPERDRFGYWPARLSRSGSTLVPTAACRFVQVIHVADLSAWLGRQHGTVTSGSPMPSVLPMSTFFERVSAVAYFDGSFEEVEDEVLVANDVRYWVGPRSLPLWLPLSDAALAQRSAGPSSARVDAFDHSNRPLQRSSRTNDHGDWTDHVVRV